MTGKQKSDLEIALKAGAYAISFGMPRIGDIFIDDIHGKNGGPYSIKFDDAAELLLKASRSGLQLPGESEVQDAQESDL